jgi:hypothetical protein
MDMITKMAGIASGRYKCLNLAISPPHVVVHHVVAIGAAKASSASANPGVPEAHI